MNSYAEIWIYEYDKRLRILHMQYHKQPWYRFSLSVMIHASSAMFNISGPQFTKQTWHVQKSIHVE